jgi:ribokinase
MSPGAEWDVVVLGGANLDYLARGSRLPRPGDTVQGDEFQEAPGGKGANQAVAAARLGARVALIARVGDDARGTALLERLLAEGVDARHVLRDSQAPTGVAVIQVDRRGEKQILTAPGANRSLSVEDVERAAPALRAARVALFQLETPLESVTAAARVAREAGARVVLDPAPAVPLPDELLRMLDVIRPNAGEAQVLTGAAVSDRASAGAAARQLLARGVAAAIVQAGNDGDLLVWSDDELWLPRLPVESVDSTGAGDAFAGALSVMLAEGRPLPEAARFASAAAALATTKLGAQAALPRREAIQALLGFAPLVVPR